MIGITFNLSFVVVTLSSIMFNTKCLPELYLDKLRSC